MTTSTPNTTTLTDAGQKLADALVKADIIYQYTDGRFYRVDEDLDGDLTDKVAVAAASLLPALEGDASLREALTPFAVSAASLTEFPPAGLVNSNLHVACKNEGEGTGWRFVTIGALVSDLHRARDALARPQPEAKGPVAAGVIGEIAAERRRQIEAEGWTPEHDDERVEGQIALAAASYAVAATGTSLTWADPLWPWSRDSWKPSAPRRMLVKAGALLIAEIERLDRASALATLTPPADPKPTVPGNDAGLREAHSKRAVEAAMTSCEADGHRCSCRKFGWQFDADAHQCTARLSAAFSALAPQTGSAGEDPKTPDAGVGEHEAPSMRISRIDRQLRAHGGVDSDDLLWLAAMTRRALTPTGSAGEDDTGVREGLVGRLDRLAKDAWVGSVEEWAHQAVLAMHAASKFLGAPQPPKAETPAGVGEPADKLKSCTKEEMAAFEAWAAGQHYDMGEHPLHYIFMDPKTDAARMGWKAGLAFAHSTIAALSAAPAARPGDGVEDAADKLANAALELAEYASYAEIVGAIRHNRSAIRTWCNAVFQAHKEYCALDAARPAAAPAADGGRA